MAFRKDDELSLVIGDMGQDGEGIGKCEGFTVFVKDAVIGDRVRAKLMKVKKSYGYGRLLEIQEPSPYRAEPACPLARPCGGCQLQALSYERQLAFKMAKVKQNLERLGGVRFDSGDPEGPVLEDILGMEEPFRYRNKNQFPVGMSRDGRIVAGLYAGRTHSLIECGDCVLGIEENEEIIKAVLSYMKDNKVLPYDETEGKGAVRHILTRKGQTSGEILVCLVANATSLPAEENLCERLKAIPGVVGVVLNVNQERTNVILGEKVRTLWGRGYVEDSLLGLSFHISALSFYQVNHSQTERLYQKALEYAALTGKEKVWDLYCGIGTISLMLARQAGSVTGVEVVPQAIEDARENALRNQIQNVKFICGKAQDVFPEEYARTKEGAEVIVVDPPRKGCDLSVIETMVHMAPDRIVYVSCDSATLARDVALLQERGYRLMKACPVDMFPQTVHVETVVLMSRI